MALIRWIRSRRDAKLVAAQVEALLAQSATQIRAATLSRAATLASAEARGYVRAKATTILASAMERSGPAVIPARLQTVVLGAATDRVTIAILEHLRERRAAALAPRRAA